MLLRVICKEKRSSKCLLRFEVIDSGSGIPQDKQKDIFKAFRQIDSSSTKVNAGTGLGLAIAQQLVRFMGGEISIDSEVARGSTFWFELELEQDQASSKVKLQEESAEFEEGKAIRARVLVAEDNEINQIIIGEILNEYGISSRVVKNGVEGVQAATSENFDLILLDCHMPEMDGFEAAKAIRAWESDNARAQVPILALTADTSEGIEELCKNCGMNEYLSKPIDPKKLYHSLEKLIAQKAPAPLDIGEALSRNMNNVKILDKVLDCFEQQLANDRGGLAEAIAEQSAGRIFEIAHGLKGAAAAVGARELQKLARELERAGRDESLEEVTEIFSLLEAEIATCLDYLPQSRADLENRRPEDESKAPVPS